MLDPRLNCCADNNSISSSTPFQYPENNWVHCEQTQLVDGQHVLTVNATIAKSQTFWFDWLHYLPSANISLENRTVFIKNTNPDIEFSASWAALADGINYTRKLRSASGSLSLASENLLFGLSFLKEIPRTSMSQVGDILSEHRDQLIACSYAINRGTPMTSNLSRHTDS